MEERSLSALCCPTRQLRGPAEAARLKRGFAGTRLDNEATKPKYPIRANAAIFLLWNARMPD